MTVVSVQQALAGKVPAGGEVTVRGWVRTRRDSKAGLSFVNVSDGSCFAPIQVVAPDSLANYESEIKHLTTGCAVVATGTLVPSQGQGQSFEIQASSVEVVGWVEDPLTYPMQPKQHSLEDLREFLSRIGGRMPVMALGLGSNLIVRDGGVPGVVIRLGKAFATVEARRDKVLECGGGASGILVSSKARDAGIAGVEFLRGIPGTVGGFVRMNGGAYGREVSDVLIDCDVVLPTGLLGELL